MAEPLTLDLLEGEWSIARLPAAEPVPDWAWSEVFSSVSRTNDELSIIAPSPQLPSSVKSEGGFRVLAVRGPLAFDAKGILADLAGAIAAADVGCSRSQPSTPTSCSSASKIWLRRPQPSRRVATR